MAPSRTVGGPSQSSANSGLFYQGDSPSQSVINSYLSSSFGNSGNSISGTGNSNIGSGSGNVILNSVSNSGPSVGASSLVTDANSGFSGGPLLQRSASINTDSYTRLPASPMSFTSNNISVSGLSGIDGPTGVQPGSHSDPNSHQLQQGVSGSSPFPTSQTGQYPLNVGPRINNSFIQDPVNLSHLQKKPRLDIEQEDIMQQQVLHELFQRQDSMQLQSANPQLQAIYQQQILLQEQPVFQSMSPVQRLQLLQRQQQYQQQQQLRNQQSMQQMAAMKNPSDTGGVCARRLMQYLYHQRQRPAENTIAYWRKFVAEYYAPRAKKRWCLSLYDNFGQHALGVFPPASMDAWHCDICGSKSGRGFEATYEVLPRLNEIEFGSGVVDELLFVDLPRERRFANGIMMLEYGKAIQESIYEQLRVVREGQLRIIFTHELKILSWDFCARRHEELLPRRLVAPQVNQPLQVAQKCQSTLSDSGPEGVSSEDLQTNSNMVIAAGRQLAKSLELPAINDLGFSKRYVRCLQIAEVVNSMKDLVDFCQDCKVGPIDGLKSYPRHNPTPWLPTQRTHEFEQPANIQGLPTDRNTINKLLAMQSGMSNANTSSNHNILANNRAALGGSAAAALSVTNYHNIMRHNSFNSSPNSLHQEAPSSFQGSPGSLSDSRQNSVFSNSQLQGGHRGQHQQPLRSLSSNGPLQGPLLAQVNQQPTQSPSSEQHMIQQLMQGAASNINPSGPQKSFIAQNLNSGTPSSGLMQGNDAMSANNVPGGRGPTLSKSESFRGPSNSESSAIGGGSISDCNQSAPKIPQNLYLTDDMVPDLPHDFADSDCFWE